MCLKCVESTAYLRIEVYAKFDFLSLKYWEQRSSEFTWQMKKLGKY